MSQARQNSGQPAAVAAAEPHPDPNRTGSLTLIIGSEVRFLRESLGEVLDRAPDISVLGYAANHEETFSLGCELRPDMVLLDAPMPNGPTAVRRLRETNARTAVVAFAVSEPVGSVLAWAEVGITGYIPNTAAMSDLRALISDISGGRQTCSPLVAAGLLKRVATTAAGAASPATEPQALTSRELEVARLISIGLSDKEIARHLNIARATTKSHVHNALRKLNAQRRSQIGSWMRVKPLRG
jgi:DNA-binding NarL/FixJ family response regulator